MNDSVYGKEFELRKSYWIGEGLTIEVNEEGKRHVTWDSYKGGLRTSKWVTRSQREHVVGPPSGSRVQKILVIGSAQFRGVAGISNKGGWRNSKWVIRSQRQFVGGPSSGSQGQSLCPTLGQTGLGSFQSNEACFLGPSIHEMGEPSSLTSPTPLAHSVIPLLSPSDKPESLGLVSCNKSDGISSNSLTVAGIEAGFNSDGLTVRPMVGVSSCLDRINSDSTAVDGLEFGTSSDGLEVAPMEINSFFSAGFNSNGHEVAQMDLYGTSPDGFNSDDFTMALSKTDMVISQLSKGIFLADILKRLSVAGFVNFGVNRVDNVGSECSVLLFQGVDNKGTRLLDMGEIGQPNLALMEPKSNCGLTVLGEECLEVCNPLLIVIPLGMALSMEVHNDIGGMLDVSKWVKNRIPGFSRVIGLSVNCHEKLCIAYLQRLEREMVVIN